MDPYPWSTLPVELVQLALTRLPLAQILKLCSQWDWSTMRRLPNFRRDCSERHSKLFGIVGQGEDGAELHNVVYDIKSGEWSNRELVGFHRAFGITALDRQAYMSNSKYACDGGLVCFVSEMRLLTTSAIRVGNPLTDEWKALPCLPCLPYDSNWKMIMVQLVTEEESKFHKVMLVCGDDLKFNNYAAQCYDSQTGAWSSMESGLVFGDDHRLIRA